MLELGAFFLAGLGLFFFGLSAVQENLQQISGPRFRALVARVTSHPALAVPVGIAFGAMTQSTAAVAFILSSMIAAGVIKLRQALPLLSASTLGTALLVLLAATNLKVALLYLLGVTGVAAAFGIGGPRAKPIAQGLFAIGALLYGLDLMKTAFAPLPSYAWFADLSAFLASWPLAPFVIGMGLRVLIQSAPAIGVIAMTSVAGGLFDEFQGGMMMAGAGPGSGLATLLLSSHLTGVARQIMLFQAITHSIAGVVIAALLVMGIGIGHLAWLFLGMMGISFLAGLVLTPLAPVWLQRLAPATIVEDLGRPRYLLDEALAVPETAIELAAKEQTRLASYLPTMVEALLPESERTHTTSPRTLHRACELLEREITAYVRELARGDHGADVGSALLALNRRQEALGQLETSILQFSDLGQDQPRSAGLESLCLPLAVALHAILLTLVNAMNTGDEIDTGMLHAMTSERGESMERIRKRYLEDPAIVSFADRSTLSRTLSLFDRIVWLVNQIAQGLPSGATQNL